MTWLLAWASHWQSRTRNIRIMVSKEIKELRRDRKSLIAVAMPAVFIPLMLVAMVHMVIGSVKHNIPNIQSPTPIALTGLSQLPDLNAYLIEHNYAPEPYTGDMKNITQDARNLPVLMVPDDAFAQFNRGESVNLTLVFDSQNKRYAGDMHRLKYLLENYSNQLASARLLSLGIDQALLKPLVVREHNLLNEKKMFGMLLTPLPIFFMLIVFTGTIGFMVDMSSGEREKRTLESLVVANPNTWVVVLAKYCAGFLVLGLVLILAVLISALGLVPIDFKPLGLGFESSPKFWLEIFGLLLPLAIMAPAVQLAIGLRAKSFKEGQTALSLLILIAMVPNFVYMANQFTAPAISIYIPIMYQFMAMIDLVSGIPIKPIPFIVHGLVLILIALGFLKLSEALLRNPKTLY